MGHLLSTAAQAANLSGITRTRDLVEITLPDPSSPLTLFLATANVTVGSQAYIGALRSVPQIKYSTGGSANGGEFTIDNSENIYGPAFLTSDRALDGGLVVVTRAWKLASGVWEKADPVTGLHYELGRGTLRTQPISDTEVKCTFVDSLSDSDVLIGGEEIPQHCPKLFNRNGTHPRGGPCGWQVSMGGNATFCDKTFDGPDGCKAHGFNETTGLGPRFGGVPAPTAPADSSVSPGTTIGDPGNPVNGGYGIPYSKLLLLDPDLRFPFPTL